MTTDEGMLDIVSSIYDTILNPDAWVLAGQKIRDRFSSAHSGLYVYNVRTETLVHNVIYGIDESFVNLYATAFSFMDSYQESDQFNAQNLNISVTNPIFDIVHSSVERPHKRFPCFGAYWKKYKCDHVLSTMINLPGHLRAGICVLRSSSIGAYTKAEKQEFEHIKKAFYQAMTLSKHIHKLAKNTAALEQTIHYINRAAFIVDSQCRILVTNHSANRQLDEKTVLCNLNGKLTACTDRQLNNQIKNAVASTCHEQITENVSLSRKMSTGPVELLICPIQKQLSIFGNSQSRALIFLLEGKVSCPHVLANIFQLSKCEKQVAKYALQGMSIKQIAATKDNSPETIKTHLRHIYCKTNTKNLHEFRQLIKPIPTMT